MDWRVVVGVLAILFVIYIIYGIGMGETDCSCGCGGAKKRLGYFGLAWGAPPAPPAAAAPATPAPESTPAQVPSPSTTTPAAPVAQSTFVLNAHNDMHALVPHSNYVATNKPTRRLDVENFGDIPMTVPANSQGF